MNLPISARATELENMRPPQWPALLFEELIVSGAAAARASVGRLPPVPLALRSFEKTRRFVVSKLEEQESLCKGLGRSLEDMFRVVRGADEPDTGCSLRSAGQYVIAGIEGLYLWDRDLLRLEPHPQWLPVVLRLRGRGGRIAHGVVLQARSMGNAVRGEAASPLEEWAARMQSDAADLARDIQQLAWQHNLELAVAWVGLVIAVWLLAH